jgi:hypothetical protein
LDTYNLLPSKFDVKLQKKKWPPAILQRAWSANFKMVWYVLLHATSEAGATDGKKTTAVTIDGQGVKLLLL